MSRGFPPCALTFCNSEAAWPAAFGGGERSVNETKCIQNLGC